MPLTPVIRPAADDDAAAIGRIYDAGVATRQATFSTGAHTAAERRAWLAAREPRAPVFVADVDDTVVGWSALAPFSRRSWYDAVAEYTVYVAPEFHGRGVGRALLDHLMTTAPQFGYEKLIGVIIAENAPGLALARAGGFRTVGTHLAHGRMDGAWRDVTIVERHLTHPHPAD